MAGDDITTRRSAPAKRTSASDLGLGTDFAGHRIEAEIGRGGMGVVYRARHVALDQPRALKLIAPALAADPDFRARFEREARLAASVDSEHVVTVHHAGVDAGRLFLSMRLVRGRDLGSLVEEDGPLAPVAAAAILDQIAEGLDAAHSVGLIHRDVKPSNILVDDGTDPPRAFLSDFGISGLEAENLRGGAGEFAGTPDYVSPEQIEGVDVSTRADIYALGGVIYFMLTGQAPFPDRPEPAKLVAHSKAPRPHPSRLAAVPRAADEVVARAMSVRPEDRYASGRELTSAFRRAIGATKVRRPRNASLLAALAAAVAAGVTLAVVLLGADSEKTTPTGPADDRTSSPGEIAGRTALTGEPLDIAAGTLKMWVTTSQPPTLTGIDPATGAVDPGPLPLGPTAAPVSVAPGFGSIWVLDAVGEELLRVDPRDQLISARIAIGGDPTEVIAGGAWLWVAKKSANEVVRVDPQTNAVDATARLSGSPRALAYNDGSVFAAAPAEGSIERVAADSGARVGEPVEIGGAPRDLAVGRAGLWVLDSDRPAIRLLRIADLRRQGPPIDALPGTDAITTGFGSVWAAAPTSGTVSRIREATGEAAGEAQVGRAPSGVAIGFGSVWVADGRGERVAQLTP